MKFIRTIFICLLVSVAILRQENRRWVVAQSNPANAYRVIFKTNHELWSIDLTTKDHTQLLELENNSQKYYSIKIDAQGTFAYIISRNAVPKGTMHEVSRPTTISAQLTRYNFQTSEINLIYEGDNLMTFILAPNEQNAILTYFSHDTPLVSTFCVYHLDSQSCADSNIFIDARYVIWIDEAHFFVRQIDNGIQKGIIFDIETMQYRVLDEYQDLYDLVVFPSKNKDNMIVTGITIANYVPEIYLSDAQNRSQQDITAQFSNLTYSINDLHLSPDGNYLAYSQRQDYIITNFDTGEILGEFSNVLDIEWLPDSSGVVVLLDQYPANYNRLITFNIQTQETMIAGEFLGSEQSILRIVEN